MGDGDFNPSFLNSNKSKKKLETGLDTKRKGHSWKSMTELVGSERPSTRNTRRKRKKAEERKFNYQDEVQTSAVMERAAELQSNLNPEFPSFFKLMPRSHVTHGFWMVFPLDFCRLHLPKCDTTIVLEGEDGVEYQTKFLYEKVGLSGGWRGFSLAHKLLEGDVLVFQLVRPCKFKVYIVRANRCVEETEVDGALNLTHLDDSANETHFACNEKVISEKTSQSQQMPLSQDTHQETPLEKAEERKFNGQYEVQTSDVMKRAAELQSNLASEFPSFFKLMLRSHVTLGFRQLGFPLDFWRLYLPKSDTTIILEGEDGVEYKTSFLSEKVGLSGGWRAFSLAHKLLEGDVLVFQLVRPCKCKVYIVRANRCVEEPEVDGALNLTHLDDSVNKTHFACNEKVISEKTSQSQQMPLSQDIHQETPLEKAEERKFNGQYEVQTSDVMKRAAELQSNLASEFPSFFKLMLRSHVTLGFRRLGFPLDFWRLYLPKSDTTIILEGEDGVEYKTSFLSEKVGLSGGWRAFSLVHKLLEGDVLVFHLVRPCKFKVYIVRTNRLAEVDGAQLDKSANKPGLACSDMDISNCEKTTPSHEMPLSQDIHQEIPMESDTMIVNSSLAPVTTADSVSGRDVIKSEDMGDCGISNLSNSLVEFQDFKIIVNGYIIGSELSSNLHGKYYELCCTRKCYLHDRVLKGFNPKLVANIISETVNIADAIRASKLSTYRDDYATWDKALEAFELMGMDVGFIRARLNRLLGLVDGSTEEVDLERYEVASCERDQVKEEVRSVEKKLSELNQAIWKLEKEMEYLKEKAERYEIMFQEEASAPW